MGMKCKELTQDFVCPMCNEDIPKVIKQGNITLKFDLKGLQRRKK